MKLLSPEGRKALLEFLRNLTPQILLLSSAIALVIAAEKPETKSPTTLYTLATGLLIVWFLAFMANFESFLEQALSDQKFINAEKRRAQLSEKNPFKRIWTVLSSVAKHSKITFIELIFAMVVIYVSMFTVLIGAVGGALKVST